MKFSLLALLFTVRAAFAADSAPLANARALYEAKKFPEAEAALKKLPAPDAANPAVPFYLGAIASARGDLDGAVTLLERAVQLAPQNAAYHHELGDVYGQSAQKAGVLSKFGLAKKCLAEYLRAAELDPKNVGYHQRLFEYYRQAPGLAGGGTDKAEAEAAALMHLEPVSGHAALVTLYASDKKFGQALDHAAEVKKLDAARGRLTYAALYTQTKEYDKAFAQFDEVLKATPDDYSALYQVGKLAAVTGQQLERGMMSLRRCVEMTAPTTPGTPGHAAAWWRIGNIAEKKNDVAGARAAYQTALERDPKFTAAAEALKKLR
jgi:tetratricopeptide (TPR) repeat protein